MQQPVQLRSRSLSGRSCAERQVLAMDLPLNPPYRNDGIVPRDLRGVLAAVDQLTPFIGLDTNVRLGWNLPITSAEGKPWCGVPILCIETYSPVAGKQEKFDTCAWRSRKQVAATVMTAAKLEVGRTLFFQRLRRKVWVLISGLCSPREIDSVSS